jgi:hypothetical protein
MTTNAFLEREWELENSDPHFITAIDWFIINGAIFDEELFATNPLETVTYEGIDYFFGPATCDPGFHAEIHKEECYYINEHVVEIAALAVSGSPLALETLKAIVDTFPVELSKENHDWAVEADFDYECNNVWVVRRFTETQLAAADFDAQMREFVALTHQVREAVLS